MPVYKESFYRSIVIQLFQKLIEQYRASGINILKIYINGYIFEPQSFYPVNQGGVKFIYIKTQRTSFNHQLSVGSKPYGRSGIRCIYVNRISFASYTRYCTKPIDFFDGYKLALYGNVYFFHENVFRTGKGIGAMLVGSPLPLVQVIWQSLKMEQ